MKHFAKRFISLGIISIMSMAFSIHSMQDAKSKLAKFPPDIQRHLSGLLLESSLGTNFEIFNEIDTGATIESAAISADGKIVVIGVLNGGIQLWDAETKKKLVEFERDYSFIRSIAFSQDKKAILLGLGTGTTRLRDSSTGSILKRFTAGSKAINAVAFSSDGKAILTGSEDKIARVWDRATQKELLKLPHPQGVSLVAFSPNGKVILTVSQEGVVYLWNAATGKNLKKFKPTHSYVEAVAFSPNGKSFLTSSYGIARYTGGYSAVHLWETSTGNLIKEFKKHSGKISSLAFSLDGKLILGGGDGKVVIWETETGELLKEFTVAMKGRYPDEDSIIAVAFSPTLENFTTVSKNGTISFWGRRINFTDWSKERTKPAHELFVSTFYPGSVKEEESGAEKNPIVEVEEL